MVLATNFNILYLSYFQYVSYCAHMQAPAPNYFCAWTNLEESYTQATIHWDIVHFNMTFFEEQTI